MHYSFKVVMDEPYPAPLRRKTTEAHDGLPVQCVVFTAPEVGEVLQGPHQVASKEAHKRRRLKILRLITRQTRYLG